jgi:hypothetical protein
VPVSHGRKVGPIEDEQWQKIGGRVYGSEVQIFTVSLDGANILSTSIYGLTSRELRGRLRQGAERSSLTGQ